MGVIVAIRHGETAWSATGRHTSTTDVELTARGVEQALALGQQVGGRVFTAVLSSPRVRAARTAALAGLSVTAVDPDLAEWAYGEYEGRTRGEILADRPDWSLWTDGAPGGESPDQVSARVDRLLDRVRPMLAAGDVALVAHGHILRVVGARWVGLPAAAGALFALGTASLSELGYEHGTPVLTHWNLTDSEPDGHRAR